LLNRCQRRRIEIAILGLPQLKHKVTSGKFNLVDSIRGRYLACIQSRHLVTPDVTWSRNFGPVDMLVWGTRKAPDHEGEKTHDGGEDPHSARG
jgi:hypothetical protein